jgi:NDP-sugar pyrophosphorylase family protein
MISGFGRSALGKFGDREAWEITIHARHIVGQLLDSAGDDYSVREDVKIHVTSVVEDGAIIKGPAIIGPNCFVAAGAYIRGGCWLEADCILGPGAELKSSFLFSGTKLAHFNFVGDSILGHDVNLEAGSIVANYRNELDGAAISFVHRGALVETGVDKFGALLGDGTKIGANAVVAPGAILPAGTIVKRLSLVDQGSTGNDN